MDDEHAAPGRGAEIDLVQRVAADADEPQVRGSVERLFEHEVGFDDERLEAFAGQPPSELFGVPEPAGVEPALVRNVDGAPEALEGTLRKRGEDQCAQRLAPRVAKGFGRAEGGPAPL